MLKKGDKVLLLPVSNLQGLMSGRGKETVYVITARPEYSERACQTYKT